MTRTVEFYPSVDVYLPDHGSMVGLNGDLKFNMPTTGPRVYLGAGLGVQTRTVNSSSKEVVRRIETGVEWKRPLSEAKFSPTIRSVSDATAPKKSLPGV
jgi:hypothetical protein